MAASEHQRRLVYDSFEEAVGTGATDFMMDRLLEHPRGDFATRDDVLASATVLQGEMAEMRAELRGEMSELRTDLRGEMSDLRTELGAEMSGLRSDLRGDMAGMSLEIGRELRGHFRATMIALAGFFTPLVVVGLYT